jgi:hypothetical protein
VFFAKLPAFSAESLPGLSAGLPAFSAKHGFALQLALAMHFGNTPGPEYQPEKPPQQQQELTPSSKTLSSFFSSGFS